MKKNIFLILSAFLSLIWVFNACTPETPELGQVISKDQLKYLITQDEEDPNMVILESLTPGLTPHWITPLGRSTKVKDTVKLAFPGDYTFAFGVQSAGGYIQAEDEVVNITTTNFDYINDPLWELLSGGVGNSKTWVLDLFPEEEAPKFAKFYNGPLYFFDTFHYWENVTDGLPVDYPEGTPSDEAWGSWAADWAGNGGWLFGGEPAQDYGTMTFDLIGGAHLIVDHKVLGRQESGVYFIDAENHKLSTTDAVILHDAGRDGQVVNWGDVRILSLTENTMQLAVVRDQALSGEGPALLCYNFISKEYSDNWVPEDLPDPEPDLPDGWLDDVSSVTSYEIKWVLSPETPFNWANLDGSLKNEGWVSPDTYADWTGMNADVPATYADFSLTMNSQNNTVAMVLPDGAESSGTYTLDEKGIYTFDGVTPAFNICSWVNLFTTAENQWRILSIEKDAGGAVTGMWVGSLATDKPEYMCWKLVPQVGGGNEGPQGTELTFDNTKLLFGNLEDNNPKFRLELYNDFGGTKNNPPLSPADVVFSNSIEITFTLQGISLVEGAAGSYKTAVQFADADWSTSYWGDGTGEGETTITGDGTYTVTWKPDSEYNTALVFCVDIVDLIPDLQDLSAVTATIDKVIMY